LREESWEHVWEGCREWIEKRKLSRGSEMGVGKGGEWGMVEKRIIKG